MEPLARLKNICEVRLLEMGLNEDVRYQKRLKAELREADAQNESGYFLDLYDRKIRYSENQNNLLIPYILGIVNNFHIDKPPKYVYGEYPDIDVDYVDVVRDYLKQEWAPKQFGEEKVCNIGNYATFGIKGAFQDMARVFERSRTEIVDITTKMGLKDDEGKGLTFAKALDMYPDLKKYCEENPDVAKAVKKLLHRNRGMGKHAGGLIVCSDRIDDFVPLVKNNKDGTVSSAWVEGLHGQDLGPVGLIKFDLLVIKDLERIARCCHLIKERHGLSGICAKDGGPDWSDTKYKNDPLALEMANRGDLKCVFQFDSDGIRRLAKDGGVTSFNDMVAYSAIYRPGPLNMKMHERYIERKNGREEYTLHPLLEPILDKTYGVLCFQEDIMKVLNAVGGIPLKDCYVVIKAVAKKNLSMFAKYKEQFLRIGKERLGWDDQQINDLWDQIESFSEYGFNKSHACAYTYISARLLWLKAHYPLEFYAATLFCEDKSEKIKEYKTEAFIHGVRVEPVHLNKSKDLFTIGDDDHIYVGFGNIKGIGLDKAQNIVAGQKYANFEDFLKRGTLESKFIKPLLGLRVFDDADPITLYKFYDCYKDYVKKHNYKIKRANDSLDRYKEDLKALLPEDADPAFTPENIEGWERDYNVDEERQVEKLEYTEEQKKILQAYEEACEQGVDMPMPELEKQKVVVTKKWNRWKELKKLFNKYEKTRTNLTAALEEDAPPTLANFNQMEWDIDDEVYKELADAQECEKIHYGFLWTSRLEDSPDFSGGHTFNDLRAEMESAGGVNEFSVEVDVREVIKKQMKKGGYFWQLRVTDDNGEDGLITVWEDDYLRFKEEMVKGNLLKLRVKPPNGDFKSYTFDSPPRWMRERMLPRDKRQDHRLIVMASPPPKEKPLPPSGASLDLNWDTLTEDT